MSYRDDLGQAHDRIKQLEDELREERAKNAYSTPLQGAPKEGPKGLVVVFVMLGIALTLGAVVFAWMMPSGSDKPQVQIRGVDEIMRSPSHWEGVTMGARGQLVSGTVKHQQTPCEFFFFIKGESNLMLPVHFKNCPPPDGFRDTEGIVVTAAGSLAANGTFEAHQLFVHLAPFPGEKRE